ncbi:hypothetical protein PNEG_03105 [Pneumocystis murina B123]|uniref:Uncharacterized protein n=1 Tax=Pneumocystis murina (strain B123) TaxID=1069680 RepID=M7PDT3_PNEMU|nr:hypothetical protein PNEG_03105 [Pneumocystis murina B123]EMR08629.1 hypothetical protein PNEG_03105 [Pneumocystis murina B123]
MINNKNYIFLFFVSKRLNFVLKRCFFCSTNIKSSISRNKIRNTSPGSHNYVPGVKGYAPDIYPPRKISFECKKKPKYPDLHKTVAEPRLKNETNTWRSKMKELRRRYLTEYVMEQKKKDLEKMQEKEKINEMIKAEKLTLCSEKHHRYSIPTIKSLIEDEYPIADSNKLERMKQKRNNYEITKDKDKIERLRHFLTLYSHSENFISSMEELDDAVNKSFQEIPTGSPPSYSIQFLYDKKENSFLNSKDSVHPEIFDALLGTVDGGKLGPDELIKLSKIQNGEKSNIEN